jgi:UDP-2-acetamido-2-deoxy-ribo-hexuluronate aminotransferase
MKNFYKTLSFAGLGILRAQHLTQLQKIEEDAHGQERRYVHTRIGVGGRTDTLQCAIVLAKLDRFEWEVDQRIKVGHRYNQLLDELGVPRVQQRQDRTSVFAQYTIFSKDRDVLQGRLGGVGVPTAVHYPIPLNEQPTYKHLCCSDGTPEASRVAKLVMSLPMGPDLRDDDLEAIVRQISGL